ncbi:MAG: WecB/TagA/CpsF family glycosyltransferase [Chloroflexi bacterium]|nr:WecB/TagA/CpsF family glycosyltransferase [Chloroflexota bacterium]
MRVTLLSCPIDILSREEAVGRIRQMLQTKGVSHHLLALNSLKVVRALKDQAFADYVRQAELVYADSAGICWALRFLYGIRQKRIPGVELVQEALGLAHEEKKGVYLLGASPQVIEATARYVSRQYPGLHLIGYHHGYLSDTEGKEVLRQLKELSPDFLAVAMGASLQERWIERIRKEVPIPVCMGVGGSFDILSGRLPRTPAWMGRMGLEWLFRLARQPQRIRIMSGLPYFIFLVVRAKVAGPKTTEEQLARQKGATPPAPDRLEKG